MTFKEITPGMVIHCPTEESLKVLCEHLNKCGYARALRMAGKWQQFKENTCIKVIHMNYYGKEVLYSSLDYYLLKNKHITEFDNLCEPDSLANEKTNG